MAENTTCVKRPKVKVDRRPDEITQTYDIEYKNVEWKSNRINKIVYIQNIGINCDERLEIGFSGAPNYGLITRHGNTIKIERDFSGDVYACRLPTNERLKNINPEIMEKILNQLSPEAKSFLEKVLE